MNGQWWINLELGYRLISELDSLDDGHLLALWVRDRPGRERN
jgi:hypothetical protein